MDILHMLELNQLSTQSQRIPITIKLEKENNTTKTK